MKRLALWFVLLSSAAFAQVTEEYYPTQPPTLQWDQSPDAALPGDVLEYEVYLWDRAAGEIDAQPIAALTLAGTTATPGWALDFPYRATWQAGVRLRHTDGGGNVSFSAMIYSNISEDCLNGVPFSYVPTTVWFPVADPTHLHDSTMEP